MDRRYRAGDRPHPCFTPFCGDMICPMCPLILILTEFKVYRVEIISRNSVGKFMVVRTNDRYSQFTLSYALVWSQKRISPGRFVLLQWLIMSCVVRDPSLVVWLGLKPC